MYLFYLFVITGAVCIIFGLIFMIKPAALVKINTLGNRVILFKNENLLYPRILGGIVLLLSAYLIYLYSKY